MTSEYRPVADRVRSTDGVDIQTYDFGGDGPLLLVCHATGFCGPVYEPFIHALTDRFHCLSMDFRAHGRSTSPVDGHMRWSGMAADIAAVVQHYSPTEPILAIGHSLGGGALVLAELARPGSLQALWAFEPILFSGPDDGVERADPSVMSEAARRRRSRFPSRREVYERYSARPPLNQLDDRCLQNYIEHGFVDTSDGDVELACSPEAEAGTFEQHRNGAAEAVMEISIPIAVAVGHTGTVVSDQLRELLADQHKVTVVDYLEVTHFGPLEVPEPLAADAGRWLLDAAGDR